MGEDTGQKKVGLYGYDSGVTTFALMEDGTAFFGSSDAGRINIDGNSAVIYGGVTKGQSNSMVMTLRADDISESTKAIDIKGANKAEMFYVDYTGKLYA
jgi:predicted GH43/DUF377 family glycosyl hydrolase